jgi:hypothetical protein
MGSGAVRHDLDRETWSRAGIEQAAQLRSHDRRAPDLAVQRLFIEDELHIGWLGLLEELPLPFHPEVRQAVGLLGSAVHPEELGCVLLRVQEAGDKERMEDPDR